MTTPNVCDDDAARRRKELAKVLAQAGVLNDPRWRAAVEVVPRHRFLPGFYLSSDEPGEHDLTRWEPVTAELDQDRWIDAAYSDVTLVTQFDGDEPDWRRPVVRFGGAPTSSSTLPSLVVRMWVDAEVDDGHSVLEIGTGTGYSTALLCERLGSAAVTSIEVDAGRLERAADALYGCGYTPTLAVADGLYGYWPEAPVDRIVAACSFRTVPSALLAQSRPGGKVLLTLGGWLYGYARVLLTVDGDGTAEGPLLDGTVSFMAARAHAAPAFGNPTHWAAGLPEIGRPVRHTPQRIVDPTAEAFHLRFLAQCAVPDAQMLVIGDVTYLVDVVSGSVASLAREDGRWTVRQSGRAGLWDRVEAVIDAYDAAGRPGPGSFRLHVRDSQQWLRHPQMPNLLLLSS